MLEQGRSWQLVQSLQHIGEETKDREGRMPFKVLLKIYGQIWDDNPNFLAFIRLFLLL